MDTDRLAALMRGYHRSDFTGWRRLRRGEYVLDFGGYSVSYSHGKYSVVIDGNGFHGVLSIGAIKVDPCTVIMESTGEDFGWSLEDRRDGDPLHFMVGAPLRRESDREEWGGCYYDMGWPELAETRPVPSWRRSTGRDDELEIGLALSELCQILMCESREGLFPDGVAKSTDWWTRFFLCADVVPHEPSEILCWLDAEGDGWRLRAHGTGYAEDHVGFRGEWLDVALVMTPRASGNIESGSCGRAGSFRQYRDENPPKWAGVGGLWKDVPRDDVDIFPTDLSVWLKWMDRSL